MKEYNPGQIEKNARKIWDKDKNLYAANDKSKTPKAYILDMFPYPSGEGLHVGHVESYTATDIISRYLSMKGHNILHPQGWDAFGLPAENYAIKTKIHPSITTKKAVAKFKKQLKMMGFSYDWSREINSSDPDYYKWTQWFFLLLYKNDLAYRAEANVNWCESCQTVLANEQVEDGVCERCKNKVKQKKMKQWFFKITDFIENKGKTSGLISGLDKVNWPESTKAVQRNWIGKSEGTIIKFKVVSSTTSASGHPSSASARGGSAFGGEEGKGEVLEIFTTKLDTIFGCTYCVVAPEHSLIENCKLKIVNLNEVRRYIEGSKKKTELARLEAKEKTGVEIKGIKAINPFTNEEIPVFVADYVLAGYGTGAVMAVPAHDERDFEFAVKYNLPIRQVVARQEGSIRSVLWLKDIDNESLNKIGVSIIKERRQMVNGQSYSVKMVEFEEDRITKFQKWISERLNPYFWCEYVTPKGTFFIFKHKDGNIENIELLTETEEKISRLMTEFFTEKPVGEKWKKYDVWKFLASAEDKFYKDLIVHTEDGMIVNSKEYNGLTSQQAREAMTKWLEKNKLGGRKINYKLRDWLISRQRYWGAPIPIIHCDKCALLRQGFGGQGEWPVPEKDLPVKLPTDVDFIPTGESPLVRSKKFHNVKCPRCGAKAKRESDTMDTFVCSSWYYFRYADPKNKKEFASKKAIEKWLPVDLYVGGTEHAVLHLLYARFFTKALHKLGYINFDEPFLKLRHQGIVLAEDGRKMSKSLNNVINPDDVVKKFGADCLRMYEMFMGPLEDAKPWNTNSIVGIYRFLERVYNYIFGGFPHSPFYDDKTLKAWINGKEEVKTPHEIKVLLHKTIKKVGEDIENLKFNTAISQLMILRNSFYKVENGAVPMFAKSKMGPTETGCWIEKADFEKFLILLFPFAPHLAEELWQELGNKKSIFYEKWPAYDPKLIKEDTFELVVQINGRVRDKVETLMDISEKEAKELAISREKAQKWIADKPVKKVIFVKNRLINLIV